MYTALSTTGAGETGERSGHLSSGVDLYKYTYSSPRTRSVVGSNPTQGSFFFEKRESCTGCLCLLVVYMYIPAMFCITVPFAIVCVCRECMKTEATLVIYMCSSKPVSNKAELRVHVHLMLWDLNL